MPDILVQPKRDRRAALKLVRNLLKRQGYVPASIVTDRLRSYGAALRQMGLAERQVTGAAQTIGRRFRINRTGAENGSKFGSSHQARRSASSRPTLRLPTSLTFNAT